MWLRGVLARDDAGLAFLRHFVTPECIVFDIGANIGQISRFVAQTLPAAHVYAFEPMPENVVDLMQNVELAPEATRKRITVVPCALTDRCGVVSLQVDDLMSQSASLSSVTGGLAAFGRRRFGLAPRTADVVGLSLDSVVTDLSLPRPSVIKVDVEGAEALVLVGGEKLLRESSVALYIELHGDEVAREVVRILHAWGYGIIGAEATWKAARRVDPGAQGTLEYIIASRDARALEAMEAAMARVTVTS
jgi:FkbM family methyltransferase